MNMPELLGLTDTAAIAADGGIGNACCLRLGEGDASVLVDPPPYEAQVVGIERLLDCMLVHTMSRFVCGGGTR